jgi:hypothetical protein
MREFQRKVSRRLLMWAIMSVLFGWVMRGRSQFWRDVGTQFIAWGAIDGLIAIGGQTASDNRLKNTPDDAMPARLQKDKHNLRLALWINAGLDVLYVLGGLRWMKRQQGHGVGVVIQGLFLLIFDVYHALKIDTLEEPAET